MSRWPRLRNNKGRAILVIAAVILSLAVHVRVLRPPPTGAELPEVSAVMDRPDSAESRNAAQNEGPETSSRSSTMTQETAPTIAFELAEGSGADQSSPGPESRAREDHEKQVDGLPPGGSSDNSGNPSIRLFRDGNRIEVVGVNVNNPKMFEVGMAVLYIRFDDEDEPAVFVERTEGMLEPATMEEVKAQYGDSILFFGNVAEKARKIRGIGLDPKVVNSGVLLGRRSILSMAEILEEHGIDSEVIRNKSIRFSFDNRTGGFSLASIHQLE